MVKHYGEAVWLEGKSYGYPFGLLKIPRMSLSFLKTRIKISGNGNIDNSAAQWFTVRYGERLAAEVILPLIEAWSGEAAVNLSPAVGDSLPKGIVKVLYLKAASILTGRAVACGYSREMPEMPSVWHVYPNGGVSTLCTKLAEGLEDSIKLDSPVNEILVENARVVAVRTKDKIIEVSAVVSTAPANILPKLITGSTALESVSHFRFRPMIFINMRFKGEKLLPDTVLWVPERKFPFFRLTEVTRSMPWLAPEGKSIITVDIGCEKDDEFWTMDEKKLELLCLDHITAVIPDARKIFLGSNVLRTSYAYPVFLMDYEKERRDFELSTNISNLLSVGRNGEFAHTFMEDVYWRTRRKVQHLINIL